jgi:hypothetical protein
VNVTRYWLNPLNKASGWPVVFPGSPTVLAVPISAPQDNSLAKSSAELYVVIGCGLFQRIFETAAFPP